MEHKKEKNTSAKPLNLCSELLLGSIDLGRIWDTIRAAAVVMSDNEPHLSRMLDDVVLSRNNLAESLAVRLARRMSREDMQRSELEPLLEDVLKSNESILLAVAGDMRAIVDRDPACSSALEPLLFYKGFLAISAYRVAHSLWLDGRQSLALYFQSIVSETFAVDIHPAAQIGCGILLDHATSIVIGETSIVEDNVSILHEVTLGGTGKMTGDRHPIVRSGVLIGAGAKILGRVEIGECAKIGAGSVVLNDVAPHKTVAGVPAVLMGEHTVGSPALDMDQQLYEGNAI
jgi:serine O-acetyltransferase